MGLVPNAVITAALRALFLPRLNQPCGRSAHANWLKNSEHKDKARKSALYGIHNPLVAVNLAVGNATCDPDHGRHGNRGIPGSSSWNTAWSCHLHFYGTSWPLNLSDNIRTLRRERRGSTAAKPGQVRFSGSPVRSPTSKLSTVLRQISCRMISSERSHDPTPPKRPRLS